MIASDRTPRPHESAVRWTVPVSAARHHAERRAGKGTPTSGRHSPPQAGGEKNPELRGAALSRDPRVQRHPDGWVVLAFRCASRSGAGPHRENWPEVGVPPLRSPGDARRLPGTYTGVNAAPGQLAGAVPTQLAGRVVLTSILRPQAPSVRRHRLPSVRAIDQQLPPRIWVGGPLTPPAAFCSRHGDAVPVNGPGKPPARRIRVEVRRPREIRADEFAGVHPDTPRTHLHPPVRSEQFGRIHSIPRGRGIAADMSLVRTHGEFNRPFRVDPCLFADGPVHL